MFMMFLGYLSVKVEDQRLRTNDFYQIRQNKILKSKDIYDYTYRSATGGPAAKFIIPEREIYVVGIGLSYCHARKASLCSLAGRYDNPLYRSQLFPQSGTMKLATGSIQVRYPGPNFRTLYPTFSAFIAEKSPFQRTYFLLGFGIRTMDQAANFEPKNSRFLMYMECIEALAVIRKMSPLLKSATPVSDHRQAQAQSWSFLFLTVAGRILLVV